MTTAQPGLLKQPGTAVGKTARTRRSLSALRGQKPVIFWVASAWLAVVILVVLAAPLLPLQDPLAANYDRVSAPPSGQHLLGTDQMGRDMLSRIVYGGRASLIIGFLASAGGMVIGVLLGMLAGFYGGLWDRIVSVLVDMFLAFPTIIFLLALVAVRGASITTLVLGLSIALTPTYARLARANAIAFAQRGFVIAAEVQGARKRRRAFREVLPNVMPAVQAYAFVVVAQAMIAEGSLSFLGLGVPPPTPSWGGMIAEGRGGLTSAPHMVMIPAIVLFVTILAVNLIGDVLRSNTRARATVT